MLKNGKVWRIQTSQNSYQILTENKLNYELELPVIPNIMISEQNPSYETSDSNLYPQEVLSLPHIDVTQILRGNLIGSIIDA